MQNAERASYAAALSAKAAELTVNLNHRDGLMLEAEPDVFDEVQSAADRALLIQYLDRNSALLREVRAAMKRLRAGSYGQCLECDEKISAKRLSAAPWASLCLQCQETADQKEASERGRLEAFITA